VRDQLLALLKNLGSLGSRRLIGIGAALVLMLAGIGTAALYLNRPAFETLYVGLERDDINRMGMTLSEAGIGFDVDASGTSILVEAGQTSRARMILAEKGLPASAGAGYELFDNLGSLGLTSFMQEVTRVRVLEGEIARSIQSINGVKAARVHIVMPDRTGFRDRDRKPTASILIRANGSEVAEKAYAIRHLVAAAVPGLASDDVTVMDATGRLLASGQDPMTNSFTGALDIERNVEIDIERKISEALGPSLGAFNYRVSVQAALDTDRRQIQETTFDPESRVERSVQVVRAKDTSQQKSASENASVEQNLPLADTQTAPGPQSNEESDRREETTNYEISSKRIDTVTAGYKTEKLSISIVVNRTRLAELLGANAQPQDFDTRLAELQKVAAAAAGLDAKRGDEINISAMEFVDEAAGEDLAPGFMERMSAYTGTAINAAAFLVVALLVLLLGVRPLVRAIAPETPAEPALPDAERMAAIEGPGAADEASYSRFRAEVEAIKPDILNKTAASPAERLKAMAELDADRTAQVLRKWILEEAA